MNKLILIAVVIGLVVYMAIPGFYLKRAVGHDNLAVVTEHLGLPLGSHPNPDGYTVNTYRAGFQPPLCVDYLVTFEQKTLFDETSKPMLRDWTWQICQLP